MLQKSFRAAGIRFETHVNFGGILEGGPVGPLGKTEVQ